MNHLSKYNISFMGIILIIILLFIIILFTYSQLNQSIVENYDNLIPNKLRWFILRANDDNNIEYGWNICKKNCAKYNKSELGCLQSCVDLIKDREFFLRSYKYNMFDNK